MPSLPIIVLGPQRSGTSALAELLHVECGVCMGHDFREPEEKDRAAIDARRQPLGHDGGYYEDFPIQRLNLRLSRGKITRVQYAIRMQQEAEQRAKCGVWGFKDPTAVQILPILLIAFPDATIIRTSRPLPDIVASWERVYHAREEVAKAAINNTELALDKYTPDAITVTTHQMTTDRAGIRKRMLDVVAQIRESLCQEQHQPISLDDSRA